MNELTFATGDGQHDINERIRYVSFVHKRLESIERLPGFHKQRHRLPDRITSQSQEFVGRLGASLVREDLDNVFTALKEAFHFKRTEMQSEEWQEGGGSILTPYFRYTSAVMQHTTEPGDAIWRRDISEISSIKQLVSGPFGAAFDGVFDTVEFLPHIPINLELLIDRIEEMNDSRVELDYDRQITCCRVAIRGNNCKIHVTKSELLIIHPQPTSTQTLVQSLLTVPDALVDFSKLT